jgi:hypothetical protein
MPIALVRPHLQPPYFRPVWSHHCRCEESCAPVPVLLRSNPVVRWMITAEPPKQLPVHHFRPQEVWVCEAGSLVAASGYPICSLHSQGGDGGPVRA